MYPESLMYDRQFSCVITMNALASKMLGILCKLEDGVIQLGLLFNLSKYFHYQI